MSFMIFLVIEVLFEREVLEEFADKIRHNNQETKKTADFENFNMPVA